MIAKRQMFNSLSNGHDFAMGKKISLTVDERVILHLMDFSISEEDFEAPEGTTQAGIAKGIGIARKHVPRAVNKLLEDNLVLSRVAHVRGAKQRKKVYYLTYEGKALGRRIWETLAKKEVVIRGEDGCDTVTTFSELCFAYQVGRTPVQIISDLQEGNVFYPHKPITDKECEVEDGKVQDPDIAVGIYKRALHRAWDDNILTKEEAAILEELRSALGITDEDHRRLQEEVLESVEEDALNRKALLSGILDVALADGRITTDEQQMLDELRRLLGVDDLAYKDLLVSKSVGDVGLMTTERREDVYADIYSSVLREAMREGKSKEEQTLINLLKKILSIDEASHNTVMDKVRKYD